MHRQKPNARKSKNSALDVFFVYYHSNPASLFEQGSGDAVITSTRAILMTIGGYGSIVATQKFYLTNTAAKNKKAVEEMDRVKERAGKDCKR